MVQAAAGAASSGGRHGRACVVSGPAALRKRSVLVSGHPTSVSLEHEFWDALRRIAADRGVSLNRLVSEVDMERAGSLSSALRVFVLAEVQRAATDATLPE